MLTDVKFVTSIHFDPDVDDVGYKLIARHLGRKVFTILRATKKMREIPNIDLLMASACYNRLVEEISSAPDLVMRRSEEGMAMGDIETPLIAYWTS